MKDNIGLIEQLDKYNGFRINYKSRYTTLPVAVSQWSEYGRYFEGNKDFPANFPIRRNNKIRMNIRVPTDIIILRALTEGSSSLIFRSIYTDTPVNKVYSQFVLTYLKDIDTNKYVIDASLNDKKVKIPIDI
ncbi:MAG: hypothetical protein OWS74_01735 [Firmicutes bacterium]|nr:hypothetical protein [Bacillota bacterium]